MKQKSFKLISGIKCKEVLGGKPRNRKHFYNFYLGFGLQFSNLFASFHMLLTHHFAIAS